MAGTAGMSEIERDLDTAQKLKDEGNEAYKAGDYKKAVARYTKIFLLTNSIHHGTLPSEVSFLSSSTTARATKEQVARAKKLRIDGNQNCSMAYEKQGMLKRALEFVNSILEFDAENGKAIYRRGHLLLLLGNLEAAERSLSRAKVLYPRDALVLADCASLAARFKEQKAKDAAKEKAMFGGIFTKAVSMPSS